MNAADFRCPRAGQVVRSPLGFLAFVPATLPPRIEYNDALVLALSEADAALSELAGVGRYLPNPQLLTAQYLRREAVLSSRIEGTRVKLAELLLGEVAFNDRVTSDEEHDEVENYVVALEHGVIRLREGLPFSLRLVREIHQRLMSGVRGGHATPGEFRRSQNWIGPPGSSLQTAPYVPPPVVEMLGLLADWEQFAHRRGVMPDLIQCALLHEQFEAIHPFLDGNGRVGRLIIPLFLIERGRLTQPLLILSSFLERRRDEYYSRLQAFRTSCAWAEWLTFFLLGVNETARLGVRQAHLQVALREEYRARLKRAPVALDLIDVLFANPYMTAARAKSVLGVSDPTARAAIRRLTDIGLLTPAVDRTWRQIFVAAPILRIAEVSDESELEVGGGNGAT